jgi:membrane-associated protease RseP (regulator of RpoE activity)
MNGVDLARFEFDLDTTWAAFFLDADLNVYSRYGGRDEKSPDSRHSKNSLMQTMREVLELHEARGKRPAAQRDKSELQPAPVAPRVPEDLTLLRQNHQGCLHCHQVREYGLLEAYHEGKFGREMLFPFPLPENLGILIDRDHGHKARGIAEGSAAERAGLEAEDELLRVNDVPVHSELDFRWALHRAPDDRAIELLVARRDARTQVRGNRSLTLWPGEDWKRTRLGWRKSLRSVPVPWGFLAYHVGREERKSDGLPETGLLIRVVSVRGQGFASALNLQKNDFIVAANGQTAEMTLDEFKSEMLETSRPGGLVRLTILRGGNRQEVTGPFPDWHTTETSVP